MKREYSTLHLQTILLCSTLPESKIERLLVVEERRRPTTMTRLSKRNYRVGRDDDSLSALRCFVRHCL